MIDMGLPAQALNRGSTYPVKQLLGTLCTTGLQVIIKRRGSSLQIEATLSKRSQKRYQRNIKALNPEPVKQARRLEN